MRVPAPCHDVPRTNCAGISASFLTGNLVSAAFDFPCRCTFCDSFLSSDAGSGADYRQTSGGDVLALSTAKLLSGIPVVTPVGPPGARK